MKKFLLLAFSFVLFACGMNANAQTVTMVNSPDTIVNTATQACSLKVAGVYKEVAIQVIVTKVSGTVAGTVTLQGSLDGTTFVTVDSSSIVGLRNTLVTTNVTTNSKVFIVNNSPYLWYKLSYTGVGTMNAIMKGFVLPRP